MNQGTYFKTQRYREKHFFFPFSFNKSHEKGKEGTTFDKTFCHVQYKKEKCIEKSSQVHLLIYLFFWKSQENNVLKK